MESKTQLMAEKTTGALGGARVVNAARDELFAVLRFHPS